MSMKLQEFACLLAENNYLLGIFFAYCILTWGLLFFCLLSEKNERSANFYFFADWQLSMFITNLSLKSHPEMSVCDYWKGNHLNVSKIFWKYIIKPFSTWVQFAKSKNRLANDFQKGLNRKFLIETLITSSVSKIRKTKMLTPVKNCFCSLFLY